MSTVTQAVAKRDNSPTSLVPQYADEFAAVLPEHLKSSAFVQLAVAALRRDPKIMEAAESNPGSLIYALRDCARLGHEPGTSQYYLTPRKEKGVLKILGIEGYQGVIERIYRAGAVSSVVVETVRERDKFEFVIGRDDRPRQEIDYLLDDDERGPLILAYAYAIMKDGAVSKVVRVNRTRIARAKSASAGSDYPSSPWNTDTEAMWLKTAAHDLEKWVPTSSEYRKESLRAAQEVAAERVATPQPVGVHVPIHVPPHDTATGEVLEGAVEDPPSEPLWPETRQPAGGAG